MPLVQFTELANSATNTAQVTAMNSYLTYPLVTLAFGVVVVIAGIFAIITLIFWMGHKISNMIHHGTMSGPSHIGTGDWEGTRELYNLHNR